MANLQQYGATKGKAISNLYVFEAKVIQKAVISYFYLSRFFVISNILRDT